MPTINITPSYYVSVRNSSATKFTSFALIGPTDNDPPLRLYRCAMVFDLSTLPAGSTVTNVSVSTTVIGANGAGPNWVIGPYNGDGVGSPSTDDATTIHAACGAITSDYYVNNVDWGTTGAKTVSALGSAANSDIAAQAEGEFVIALRQLEETTAYTYAELDVTTALFTLSITYTAGGATSTGALSSQSASISGVGEIVKTSQGVLNSQAATLSGSGEIEKYSQGVLAAQAAVISGTAERAVPSSGALSSQSASMSGAGIVFNVVDAVSPVLDFTSAFYNLDFVAVTGDRVGLPYIWEGSTITLNADGTFVITPALPSGTFIPRISYDTSTATWYSDTMEIISGVVAIGALSSQAATVSGAASIPTGASGVLASQSATLSGVAEREVVAGGVLAAQAAAASGVATVGQSASGVLTAQAATLSGAAIRTVVTISAQLAAQSAAMSGTAERNVAPVGILNSSAATVSGSGFVIPETAAGNLSAQAATISGIAERAAVAVSSLQAQAAAVSGSAVRVVISVGQLNSQPAVVSGVLNKHLQPSGDLISGSATINGVSIVIELEPPVCTIETQKAIYNALKNNQQLSLLLAEFDGELAIFDTHPQVEDSGDDSYFPYITLGEVVELPFDTDTETGCELTVSVNSWSRSENTVEVKKIMAAVSRSLHRQDLEVVGFDFIGCDLEYSDVTKDPDGVTLHGVQRFLIKLEEN